MADANEEIESQPLLPRIGMIWFFIAVTVASLALFVVRAADQGQSLAAAMVFICVFFFMLLFFWGGCFLAAYLFGVMEKAVAPQDEQVGTPFIDGSFPEQIIPPKPTEES